VLHERLRIFLTSRGHRDRRRVTEHMALTMPILFRVCGCLSTIGVATWPTATAVATPFRHFSVFEPRFAPALRLRPASIANVAQGASTVSRSADGFSTWSTSSMCHRQQAQHSKVYTAGSSPNRGVLRTNSIGRAQPKQRGKRTGLSSGATAQLAHMTCFQFSNGSE
jgi:hypothetical protein